MSTVVVFLDNTEQKERDVQANVLSRPRQRRRNRKQQCEFGCQGASENNLCILEM